MPTSGTGPYWFAVLPVERTNALPNPSVELGTTGWAGTGTGPTLGSVSDFQAFGAYSLRVTGANDGIGATATAASIGSGSAVWASAYVQVRGASGGSVQIGVGGTTSRVPVGSVWQRVAVGTVATGATAFTLAVQRFGANSGTLYVDGAQVEGGGSITTYIDGDQDGCRWLGAPHASASLRPGQTRAGGSAVALRDLGLLVEEAAGHGAPPLAPITQPYALTDGAEYQRTRTEARPFSLTGYVGGTTTADYHQMRRRLIDALKVDAVGAAQPVRLLYTGAGGTSYVDAVWGGGLEIAEMEGPMGEPAATLRLVAPDPYFRGETQRGTSLAPYTVLGSTNFAAYRDPAGRWGTMAGVVDDVYDVEPGDLGTVYMGGRGTLWNGSVSNYVAMWTTAGWGTLSGGTIGTAFAHEVRALRYRLGTLAIAGTFAAAAGTRAVGITYWAGAFGTYGPGTLAYGLGASGDGAFALAYDGDGGLIVGGAISAANGTTAPSVARWQNGWGTIGALTAGGGRTFGLAEDGAGGIVAVGEFTIANGTNSANGIATYRAGAWGTLGGGQVSLGFAVAVTPGRDIYVLRSGTMSRVATSAIFSSGSAQFPADYANNPEWSMLEPLRDGRLIAGPVRYINGSVPAPGGYAIWNGYTWLPSDVRIPTGDNSVPFVFGAAEDAAGTLWVGGDFYGIGTAASVTTVVNPSTAACYPTLRLRNTGAGTARVYQVLNTTTGDGIWFNYVMAAGERADLVLEPGAKSFTSDARGNILSAILPGSNLATWRLLPGTNTVSFFSDGAGVVADLFWENRLWSADAIVE